MAMKLQAQTIFLSLSVATAAVFSIAAHASAEDIRIAVAGPMTGATAAVGEQMKNGAQAAVDAINSAGGLLGEKIILEVADDACDPKQAVAVANRLASEEVGLVVGHYCSSSSIPASDVYAEANIIQISPGSTNPTFTERGLSNVFRVCGRDDQQGAVAAEYILAHYKDKKIAILDDNSTAGKGVADVVNSKLEAAGIKLVGRQSYVPGEKDYTAVAALLKNMGAEVVYIGGYYTEVGLIKRQSAGIGHDLIVVSADPLMTDEYWTITGPAGNGTIFTFMPDATKNAAAAAVVGKLQAAGLKPEGFTLYAYAAVQAWAAAVEKSGSIATKDVKAALKSNEASTVIGPVRFDGKGDNLAPGFVVYRWKDGKAEYAN